jgi:hypothetical protein
LKNTFPATAKAAIDFEAFTARLKPRPFKANSLTHYHSLHSLAIPYNGSHRWSPLAQDSGLTKYSHCWERVEWVRCIAPLMLNGRYDFFFPVDSTQEPFYQMLGSKKDQKKHLVYETSHNIPRNQLIKESTNWLDQYLGPSQN